VIVHSVEKPSATATGACEIREPKQRKHAWRRHRDAGHLVRVSSRKTAGASDEGRPTETVEERQLGERGEHRGARGHSEHGRHRHANGNTFRRRAATLPSLTCQGTKVEGLIRATRRILQQIPAGAPGASASVTPSTTLNAKVVSQPLFAANEVFGSVTESAPVLLRVRRMSSIR